VSGVRRLYASAPGKLVVSGEYAVLAGAPAIVQAFDRRVRCRVEAGAQGDWSFQSQGVDAQATHRLAQLLHGPPPDAADPAWLAYWLLQALAASGVDTAPLPLHLQITIDSRACFHHGRKLGLGSSAAVCVALGASVARLAGGGAPLPLLVDAHRRAQGSHGSGLDIAAAWQGGTLTYRMAPDQSPLVAACTLPAEVGFACVFTGQSTATAPMLTRFAGWRAAGRPAALAALCDAAEAIVAALTSGAAFMAQLAAYVECLGALDRAASLGIYSTAHQRLHRLANQAGVVYKPCGAGGGDMGMAFALDADALADFIALAGRAGYTLPAMEPDRNGIELSTRG
jgi:phosphomevalonate kinase